MRPVLQCRSCYTPHIGHPTHTAGEKGKFNIDDADDAVRQALVLRRGELTWPPPALPAPPPPPPQPEAPPPEDPAVAKKAATFGTAVALTAGVAGVMGLGFVSPSALPTCFTHTSSRRARIELLEYSAISTSLLEVHIAIRAARFGTAVVLIVANAGGLGLSFVNECVMMGCD